MIRVFLTQHEISALAMHITREADALRADGRHDAATVLEWRAAALQEAAR